MSCFNRAKKVKALRAQVDDLQTDNEKCKKQLKDYEEACRNLNKRLAEAEATRSEQKAELDRRLNAIDRLKEELDVERTKKSNRNFVPEKEVRMYRETNRKLSKSYTELSTAVNEHKDIIDRQFERIKSLEGQLQSEGKNVMEFRASHDYKTWYLRLNEEYKKAKQQIEEYERNCVEMQEKCEKLQKLVAKRKMGTSEMQPKINY